MHQSRSHLVRGASRIITAVATTVPASAVYAPGRVRVASVRSMFFVFILSLTNVPSSPTTQTTRATEAASGAISSVDRRI